LPSASAEPPKVRTWALRLPSQRSHLRNRLRSEKDCGGVKLTPEQQQSFLTEQPQTFSPLQGGWGRMGMTFVHLKEADESLISGALQTAYHNLQKKQSDKKSSRVAKPARPSH
jgi:hypothetical protein